MTRLFRVLTVVAIAGVGVGAGADSALAAVCNIERVSVSDSGAEGDGPSARFGGDVAISGAGRYVLFGSEATNLIPGGTNGSRNLFLSDTLTNSLELISVAIDGTPAGPSGFGQVTADGRYVVFQSCASNLVFGDTNGTCDIFVRDRLFGTTEVVSRSSTGELGNDGSTVSQDPFVSADGRFVSYDSTATNLVAGDTNNASNLVPGDTAFDDVFVRDSATGAVELISVSAGGGQADANSGSSLTNGLSAHGRFAVFQSVASNLVAGTRTARTTSSSATGSPERRRA